jgi:hypothetical protein
MLPALASLPTINIPLLSPRAAPPEVRLPELAFKFPNIDLPTDYIVHFCFPHGVPTKGIVASPSMSAENEIFYDSLKKLERSDSSYVFRISTEAGVIFGVCVRRDELLEVNTLQSLGFAREWEKLTRADSRCNRRSYVGSQRLEVMQKMGT